MSELDGLIYLDNAATTRVLPEAVEAARRAMEACFGNPSSRHRLGLEASRVMEGARSVLARAIGADEAEIIFTGGGSEANNLALKGSVWAYGRTGGRVVVSAVEHDSVLESVRWLGEAGGVEVRRVPVGRDGRVRVEDVLEAVDDKTLLVSLMHVNNEVGAVQPVAEVGRALRARKSPSGRRKGLPLFHVDAVQSLGRLPVDVGAWGADLVSFSAHKVHGPKGVGALFVRKGVRLVPLVHGGGHEAGRRSGTENVPGIAGFGAALEVVLRRGPDEMAMRLARLRERLVEDVRDRWPDVVVNGPKVPGWAGPGEPVAAPHIVSLSFPGVPAEALQHHLETAGVYVSTGSACSSHHRGRGSHVLEAMGCPPEVAGSAIRVSFSVLNTEEEVAAAAAAIVAAVGTFRSAPGGPRRTAGAGDAPSEGEP